MRKIEYDNYCSIIKWRVCGMPQGMALEGMWKVDVTATRLGIPTVALTFNVDAR